MSFDDNLPAELLELERALKHEGTAPSAELEARVRNAMRQTLYSQRRLSRWRFAVAAAAVLLIGLHVSWPLSAVGLLERGKSDRNIEQEARAIRELAPELSERDVLQQARLMAAGGTRGWGARPVGGVPLPVGSRLQWE